MDTVTQVLEHPQYKACCETITDYEADRTYCRHDMEHFLRVGQTAILLAKENGLSIDAEEIMLAASFMIWGVPCSIRMESPMQNRQRSLQRRFCCLLAMILLRQTGYVQR